MKKGLSGALMAMALAFDSANAMNYDVTIRNSVPRGWIKSNLSNKQRKARAKAKAAKQARKKQRR